MSPSTSALGFNVALFLILRVSYGMSFGEGKLVSEWWMVEGFSAQSSRILEGVGVWMRLFRESVFGMESESAVIF